MLIEIDLNVNDLEALIRHARSFDPSSDDARENRRLRDALDMLLEALEEGMGAQPN